MTNKMTDYEDDARMVTDDDLEQIKSVNDGFSQRIKSSKKKNKNNNDNDKSFNRRFFLYAFLIILSSFLAAFFIKRSFAIVGEQNVTYQENSNLDYKVYLKPNDFYEDEYLGKNKYRHQLAGTKPEVGIVLKLFAVVTNNILDKSKGTSK